jgi:hypothetical protein
MTDDMWHLIEQCWEQDPKKRAKIEHALSYFDRDGTTDQKYMFLAKSIGACECLSYRFIFIVIYFFYPKTMLGTKKNFQSPEMSYSKLSLHKVHSGRLLTLRAREVVRIRYISPLLTRISLHRIAVPEHVFPDPSMFTATAKEACTFVNRSCLTLFNSVI